MNLTNNCPDCDLPLATQQDFDQIAPGEGEHLCWREFGGARCEPIDWRQRAIDAERKLAEALDSEEAWIKTYESVHGALLSAESELETLRALVDGEPWAGAAVKRERDRATNEAEDLRELLRNCDEVLDEFSSGYCAVGSTIDAKAVPRAVLEAIKTLRQKLFDSRNLTTTTELRLQAEIARLRKELEACNEGVRYWTALAQAEANNAAQVQQECDRARTEVERLTNVLESGEP